MGTYTQILYQIVFSTKRRKKVLIKENREKLFKYMWGVLNNNKCHVYQINGVEDHLHIITHLHPTVALSDLVKDIKVSSSRWIKEEKIFKGFVAWQVGYGAFTYSIEAKDNLVNYVKNQENHHRSVNFKKEYIDLLEEFGVTYEEMYLF